jgi:hypothetical protein
VRSLRCSGLGGFTAGETGEKKARYPPESYTSIQVILLIAALLLILVTVFGRSTWSQPLSLLLMGVVIGMQVAPRLLRNEAHQ